MNKRVGGGDPPTFCTAYSIKDIDNLFEIGPVRTYSNGPLCVNIGYSNGRTGKNIGYVIDVDTSFAATCKVTADSTSICPFMNIRTSSYERSGNVYMIVIRET